MVDSGDANTWFSSGIPGSSVDNPAELQRPVTAAQLRAFNVYLNMYVLLDFPSI